MVDNGILISRAGHSFKREGDLLPRESLGQNIRLGHSYHFTSLPHFHGHPTRPPLYVSPLTQRAAPLGIVTSNWNLTDCRLPSVPPRPRPLRARPATCTLLRPSGYWAKAVRIRRSPAASLTDPFRVSAEATGWFAGLAARSDRCFSEDGERLRS